MREIDEIIIHCTATRPNWMHNATTRQKVDEVRRWHKQDRGWSDIGYHYLIDRDGTVSLGRPIERTGAHTVGHNKGTVAISLFGGFDSAASDKFSDNFTIAQRQSLEQLVRDLKTDHPTIKKVSGHNDYAQKACPGFRVNEIFPG
jgi:N-acetylmuramoyl-L-alanine amidase